MNRLLIIGSLLSLVGIGVVAFFWHSFAPAAVWMTPLAPSPSIQLDSYTPVHPTLESIFLNSHQWTATLSATKKRTVIATGDIMPARSVNMQVLHRQDFTWPYLKTYELTRNADITFINLETPLLKDCSPTDAGMVFCGDARHVEGLVFAGADIANLANNHAGNYGAQGVQETIRTLEAKGIRTTGTSGPFIREIRGVRFAFLGYNDISSPQPGVSNVSEELIRSDIATARSQADIVIVTYHWGGEYREQPDERQRFLGHLTIDAGADLVIGNHAHWIQPVEIYKGKLITYAHGNFVFDQMWSQKTREGVVGKYTFYDRQLVDVEFTPIRIDFYGQPQIPTEIEQQRILREMSVASDMLRLTGSGGTYW